MPEPPESRVESHRSPSPPPAAAPAPGEITFRDDVPLDALPAPAWNSLAPGQPLLAHALFAALHASGCASERTGWRPRFLTGWRGERLVAALPLYEKAHSYGEYVFDWAWADFYRRNGVAYYPKLVAAVPFTPATGPRLLVAAGESAAPLLESALQRLHAPRPGDAHGSSLHLLFITAAEAELCSRMGMSIRHGLQFHWTNPGYRDFDDYLAAFNHDRRKKIRQERRKLAAAGVTFERKTGAAIVPEDWAHFHRCYENTYHAHGSTPYLDLGFFHRLGETMPEALLLIVGRRNGSPVCAALDVYGGGALWGRHWGTIEPFPGLHFEACYYQAIEFCIERGIARFEGGAQGLHKLARGLLPVPTYSAHAVADARFGRAIADFCARERASIAAAREELARAAPLRHRGDADRQEAAGADESVADSAGPADREP
jgi:predicted N-acyltransferase